MSYPRYVPNETTLADSDDYTAFANHVRSGSYTGYNYLVLKAGSNYKVYNSHGDCTLTTASLSNAINTGAIANLTASRSVIETVKTIGSLSLDDTINVPNYTRLDIAGKITLNNSVNKPMIRSVDGVPHDIELCGGGCLDGNYSNNDTSGHGIYFYQTGSGVWMNVESRIHNLRVVNTRENAIRLVNSGSNQSMTVYVSSVRLASLPGTGLYMRNLTDTVLTNMDVMGSTTAISLSGCMACNFSNFRTDGAITLSSVEQCSFSNFFLDTYGRDIDGIWMYSSVNNSIGDGMIRADGNDGYNTKSAILILASGTSNTCKYNLFYNLNLSRPNPWSATNRFAYGIKESNEWGYQPDYNLYVNINSIDTVNGNWISGSNSKISNSFP